MALSIVSLVVALVALTVNVSALIRRPRILAEWGYVSDGGGYHAPVEGLSVIATARRRPIEVDEIGIVLLPRKTWRRRLPEWLNEQEPFRYSVAVQTGLPKRLEDGQSLRGFAHLDVAADEFHERPGHSYSFVRGSGTVYLARDSKLGRYVRKRRRVGEAS